MKTLISKFYMEQAYISIYFDIEDTDHFVYGRIIAYNDDYVAIYMVSPDGLPDGVMIKAIDDIIRIEVGGQYNEKMKKMGPFDEKELDSCVIDKNDMINSLLRIAQENRKIVSIEIVKSGYNNIVGFVDNLSCDLCQMAQVDEYGYMDGISYIKFDDITQIVYNSQDERRVHKLWNINY